MASYQDIKAVHKTLPQFTPHIPVGLLPYLAFSLLVATFALTFYFTTLPKDMLPLRESITSITASVLAGFGVVSLFCVVGVYV